MVSQDIEYSLIWVDSMYGFRGFGFSKSGKFNEVQVVLKRNKVESKPTKIRESINNMNFAKFESGVQTFLLKTKIDSLGSNILRAMRISPPKNLSKPEEISL